MQQLKFGVRNPASHPEDTKELTAYMDELHARNFDTAAKVGLFDFNNESEVIPLLAHVEFRGSGEDQSVSDQEYVFVIDDPAQLCGFDRLFNVLFPTDEERLNVTMVDGTAVEIILVAMQETEAELEADAKTAAAVAADTSTGNANSSTGTSTSPVPKAKKPRVLKTVEANT